MTDCEKIDVFERRVLRIIYGPTSINGESEWEANITDDLYNYETIVQRIKVQRLVMYTESTTKPPPK